MIRALLLTTLALPVAFTLGVLAGRVLAGVGDEQPVRWRGRLL